MTPSSLVARRVQMLRRSHGLNREQLADECTKVGAPQLTAAAITNIETGRRGQDGKRRRHVTVDELVVFGQVFEITPADLLGKPCETCNNAPPPGFTCKACGR